MINSHVQISKSILKYFANKTKKVEGGKSIKTYSTYVLDLKTGIVEYKNIKETGIEFGYFDDSTEEMLNKEYESHFGSLMKEIVLFLNGKKEKFDFSNEKLINAKNFFRILFFRNKKMLELYNCYTDLFPIEQNQFVNMANEIKINPFDDYNNYAINFFKCENGNLITSYSGFCIYVKNEKKCIFLPLCPYGGLYFYPVKSNDDVEKGYLLVDEENTVNLNKYILVTEKCLTNDFIVGKEEKNLLKVYKG